MNKTMELQNIKIDHSPMGVLLSFGYVLATVLVLFLERALGFLGLSLITVTLLAVLMTIDFLTGVWKSKRLEIPITSRAGKEGFYEKVVSIIGLLTLTLIIKLAGIPTGALVNTIMVIGGLIEAYSIFGNLQSIITRKPITEQDALTYALIAGRKKLYRWLKFLLRKGDPDDGEV